MLPGDVHASGRGMCASQGGGMHAFWGVHAWPGVCMAGGMHGGGHVWLGACMAGSVHGRGACMADTRAVRILLECILVMK